jgi:hypothetical protein
MESELLGLMSGEILSHEHEPYIATLRRRFLPEAVVDVAELKRRGYQK